MSDFMINKSNRNIIFYITSSIYYVDILWYVKSDGYLGYDGFSTKSSYGVCPVIVISKDLF